MANISYLDYIHSNVSEKRDEISEEIPADASTIFCIVVVALVVVLQLIFCACCYGDCSGSRTNNQDGNVLQGREDLLSG